MMKRNKKLIIILCLITVVIVGVISWSVIQTNKNSQSISLATYNRDAQEISNEASIIAIVQASKSIELPEDSALTWRLTDVNIIKEYTVGNNKSESPLQIRQTADLPADIKLDPQNTYLVFLEPYVRGGKTDGTYVIADAWNGVYKISASGIVCGYSNDGSEIQTGKVIEMKTLYDSQIKTFAQDNPTVFS